MATKLVRTQIYLPQELHQRLKKRGKKLNKSLAQQIREALNSYLFPEETKQQLDDSIWQIVGKASSGIGDLARNHDKYLYGWNKKNA